MTGDSTSLLGDKRSAELSGIALQQQIEEHKKADDGRSVLGWAISQIWRSDEGSLTRLQNLQKDWQQAQTSGDAARVQELQQQITKAIEQDKDAIGLQGEISYYGGGALKTAALFFGGGKGGLLANNGTIGLAASVGLYGLDTAKMNDDASTFAANLALGGAKGGLTKALFQSMGSLPIESPAAKGIVLGMGARLIDTSLTKENYKDGDGNFSLTTGLGKVAATATDTRAMFVDAALFAGAHGLTRGANWLTKGAVDARPVYNTVATSTSFGLGSGAYHELDRQVKAGEQIDYTKIFGRALLQGAVDSIAGIPGGLNADPHFRQRPWETLKADGRSIASRFGYLSEPGMRAAKESVMGEQPVVHPTVRRLSSATDGKGGDVTVPEVRTERIVSPTERTTERVTERTESRDRIERAKETESTTPPKEYSPEVLQAAKEVLDVKIGKLEGRAPTFEQLRDLNQWLGQHPEADVHAATLYVRMFSNPAVRRAIEGFYKPGFAMGNETALATPQVREAYERFEVAMREPANRTVLPHILGQYINNLIRRAGTQHGGELREVIEHHARTTYDTVAAKAIDSALKTRYAGEIEGHAKIDRDMPLTQQDIEYVRAIATGKPLPGGPTRIVGDAKFFQDFAEGIVSRRGRFNDADLAAAQRQAHLPSELVMEAQRGISETITKQAEQMRTGTREQVLEAANKLADHLAHESAGTWFAEWVKHAPNTHISAAGELAKPVVAELISRSPDTVRSFLASDPAGLPLSYRFRALSEVATAFEGKPQIAEAVLKVAGENPTAMRQIGHELTRGFARQQYAQWLETMLLPKEGSATPLTADTIVGDAALRQARIFSAFGDTPVGRYLQEYAVLQPEMAQSLLQKLPRPGDDARGGGAPGKAPRGQDMQMLIEQVIQRRIAERVPPDALPQQLDPNLLQMEIRLQNAFKKNPEALETLLQFARENLPEVSKLIQMPMTPEGAALMGKRAPRGGPPDRNDPTVRAQMDLKKLGMAYMDLVGMMAPKVAEKGPQAALAEMQAIQAAFADVIIKNYAANMHPDNFQMRQNAELAERDLNRMTDQYLPQHEAARRDAQLRREAISKQEAALLPNGPPPDINAAPRTTPVVTQPAETGTGTGTGTGAVERPVDPKPPVEKLTKVDAQPDLGIGPQDTVADLLGMARPPQRRQPVLNEDVLRNIEAQEAAKQQDYQRRKGKRGGNDSDGEVDGGGRGKKKASGYRSAREWRESQRDDWE
jgi:hypothetical protein